MSTRTFTSRRGCDGRNPPARPRGLASAPWTKGEATIRKLSAELLGTLILVYFAVGVATLSFGFGATGASFYAGVVATALAFGLTLLASKHR